MKNAYILNDLGNVTYSLPATLSLHNTIVTWLNFERITRRYLAAFISKSNKKRRFLEEDVGFNVKDDDEDILLLSGEKGVCNPSQQGEREEEDGVDFMTFLVPCA